MPLFKFYCKNCATEFEIFCKKAVEIAPCQQCKGNADRILAKPAHFSVEGAGVVANEYPIMDRYIGKDSEIRQKINEEKGKAKWEIRKNEKQYALAKVKDTVINIDPMRDSMKNLPTKDDFITDYVPLNIKEGTHRDEIYTKVAKEDWKSRRNEPIK